MTKSEKEMHNSGLLPVEGRNLLVARETVDVPLVVRQLGAGSQGRKPGNA